MNSEDNNAKKAISEISDPWEHRGSTMECQTCMWFVVKGYRVGRCRKHAPTMSGYPVVFLSDWCGDHKLDENKH